MRCFRLLAKLFVLILICSAGYGQKTTGTFYTADNKMIQYVGRIDFTHPKMPRFWQPGVYIKAKFSGSFCEIHINDEELGGKLHNYISISVDGCEPIRLQTTGKRNRIDTIKNLSPGEHTIIISKNTEAGIGYLEFVGLTCEKLLPLPKKPLRKLEFIGNSITCGTGADVSVVPCGGGEWHDQHNAYMSYGPLIARALNAQWHLSSVSGIGLIRSCCNMDITMPIVFDKVNMRNNTLDWNFKNYQPDVLSICLGQNDGVQDSLKFCSAYVNFIKGIRKHYSHTTILCITSPMADANLAGVLKNYLTGVVSFLQREGDKKIDTYFFSQRFNNGCDDHPDLHDHEEIASELTAKIRSITGW